MTVLIADDSQVVAERLKTLLSEVSGIETAGQAGTVPEALHAVRSLRPDVVVLDVQMPRGRGIDVLKTIRRERTALAVIVLASQSHSQYRKKCLENGAHSFLDKSTEFHKVAAVLGDLVTGVICEAPEARGS